MLHNAPWLDSNICVFETRILRKYFSHLIYGGNSQPIFNHFKKPVVNGKSQKKGTNSYRTSEIIKTVTVLLSRRELFLLSQY